MQECKRFKCCMLHIGTEKTGTSTIQRFLSTNRELLRDEGYLYTTSAGNESQFGFVGLVDDSIINWKFSDDLLSIDTQEKLLGYRHTLINNLEKEFSSPPHCHTLIISSEHMHSRLRSPEKIAALKNILNKYADNYKIIVYFRRQVEQAISYYSTKLKSGATNPILFPRPANNALDYYFNHLEIYENWARVFGEDNIMVREYNHSKFINGNLISDFCFNAGISNENKNAPKDVNKSLNTDALVFLREMNKLMPYVINNGTNKERVSLIRFLESRYAGKPNLATRKQAINFYEMFRCNNNILNGMLEKRGITPLFNDDFSNYPEAMPDDDEILKQISGISLDIWRHYQNELSRFSAKSAGNQKQEKVYKRIIRRLFKS